MARKARNKKEKIEAYRHEKDTRKNAVLAGLASYDTSKPKPKKYEYNPHLDPSLQFDSQRDQVEKIIDEGLNADSIQGAKGALSKLKDFQNPYLNWAGKAEHTSFEVPTVSLHIHEHIATEAIIRSVKRKDPQMYLFAKPDMPLKKLVEFYQHDMDWTNRLILGDSLLITNSLLEREMMAGKVQCIYVDPPYGVRFSSNFQPTTKQRDVKDQDNFMVREPEQIRAYRDTWQLGIHSYLTYLRDRLLLSRELLTESGSIFVQISDENLHHVKELMDEVFGKENYVSIVTFSKTSGQSSILIPLVSDYLLWYCKEKDKIKYRQLFVKKEMGQDSLKSYQFIELPDGKKRKLRDEEKRDPSKIPFRAKIYRLSDLASQGFTETGWFEYEFNGKKFVPPTNRHWTTSKEGLDNLKKLNRLQISGQRLNYIRYLDDYPVLPIHNFWTDTGSSLGGDKIYVVQTTLLAIQRCILMTTDPGDLVFDPTCGSGTTAYVAEQWGRRWITCDTSRVALTIARQRLMTAVYPYYKLADERMGVKGGFIYEEVPHITLKSIAQNEPPQTETLFDKPEIDGSKVRITGPFTVEGIPQHSVTEFEDVNYETEIERESQTVIVRSEATKQSQVEAHNHIHTLIELLRKDGVTFPGNKRMKFENLIPVSGGFIHAEGEPADLSAEASAQAGKNGLEKVAVSFGPPHGPVTVRQVEDGIHDAYLSGYDAIIFCGFAFDAAAQDVKHPKIKVFYSHIRPDVLVGDLLKTTSASQLFTVFGEPDIEIKRKKNEYEVILKGVDIYDPLTGEVYSGSGDRIAAWFIDTDYDKRSFCVSQAFFPDSKAWDKLKRALKASIDEDKFELLTSTHSLPFKSGKEKRIAVKVIDHRGNEVMVVREVWSNVWLNHKKNPRI